MYSLQCMKPCIPITQYYRTVQDHLYSPHDLLFNHGVPHFSNEINKFQIWRSSSTILFCLFTNYEELINYH